ncbi:MAG: riboflavin biosynthesis protein RibF [Dysgonamonadaceae bacterium]|jgi:riboflavin kinase/FMN adenylyltransferase|nr:riboflavin biosynthesis protein RibF [Dysgonamonadaceae bacterium]
MEIIDIQNNTELKTNIAATIGFFDGVHAGHRFLIEQLKRAAEMRNLPSALITFRRHPQTVLRPGDETALLNTLDERLSLLASTGIDYCLLADFSPELSQLDAKTFIHNVLRKQLSVSCLVIGYDHRFGKNRAEGFEEYLVYGSQCGIEVIPALEFSKEIHVSSTAIRRLLFQKKLEDANRLLTYDYSLEGIVVEGNKLGCKIGFPTANLELLEPRKVIPSEGIYAVRVYVGGEPYGGMAYIGKRPTVAENGEQSIEVNIFDFSGNLYGKTLRLEFVRYVRDDCRFDGIESLIEQLKKDKSNIQNILSKA